MTRKTEADLKVLVVDDSAVVRQFLSRVLSQEPSIHVTSASDPLIAMRKMSVSRPDVMVLDLEMPRMDGLTFLRTIMAENPLPVVICSSHVGRGTETALEALREGAVDIIAKPSFGLREFLEDSALTLIDTVRAAAQAKVSRRATPLKSSAPSRKPGRLPLQTQPGAGSSGDVIVAIGASTGGPEALATVLGTMPPDAPAMVVVQHMPAAFTAPLAKRLNESCRVEVQEATAGARLERGKVLLSPGNRHLAVHGNGSHYWVELSDGPLVSRHRPSVDVLFQSVAKTAGDRAVGVILTGMGDDGVAGLLAMKRAGAATIAQDEYTSVVFGMPKEALSKQAADYALPVSRIASFVLESSSGHNLAATGG